MAVIRLISNSKSGIRDMTPKELKAAIKGSEGRVIMSQLTPLNNMINDATNPELAQAMGADMIMVNAYNMQPDKENFNLNNANSSKFANGWYIHEYKGKETGWVNKEVRLKEIKELIDIPIGIYLEVGNAENIKNQEVTTYGWSEIAPGRKANKENFALLKEEGADFVVLAGNPGSGVRYENIIKATKECREVVGDDMLIFAGNANYPPEVGHKIKLHSSENK